MAPNQIAYMPNPDKSGCVWRTDLGCSKASAVTRSWQSFTAHEFFETITDRTGPSSLGRRGQQRSDVPDPS